MNRIHTNYRGDGINYRLYHNLKNNSYEIICGTVSMYTYSTLRTALNKFKQLLYITD